MQVYTRTILLIMSLALAGCDGSDVKKGDPDYPRPNPTPSMALQFHGSIDHGAQVKFASYWIVTNDKMWPVADGTCNYMGNKLEGVTAKYTLVSPIKPRMDGDQFDFSIFKDEFLPGRCGWKFSGVLVISDKRNINDIPFEEKNSAIESSEIFVDYNPSLTNWSKDQLTTSTGNITEISCPITGASSPKESWDKSFSRCLDSNTKNRIRVRLDKQDNRTFEIKIHGETPQ